jgi:hypothetical protein
MTINKHGLSRTIPSAVKRHVRQRCGFGCVICGNAIVHYEHVDPPFSEATRHDPDAIALLCGTCHDKVTRRLVAKETVLQALAHPRALEAGYSRDAFDITSALPMIEFCGTTFLGVQTIVAMMGVEILSVSPPECAGAPMRISALFCDQHGHEVLRIVNNEWFSNARTWDIEVKGQRIIIRRAPKDIALVLRTNPPDTIVIERIAMYYQGARVEGREGGQIDAVAPNGNRLSMVVKRVHGSGSETGLVISERGVVMGYSGTFQSLRERLDGVPDNT